MTEEQRLIYTEGIILQAKIELEAMLAANREREVLGLSLAFTDKDIEGLIEKYGMHHNALITNLMGEKIL